MLIQQLCFVTVGFSGPHPELIKKRPLGTLAGPNVLLSLMVHLLLVTSTQLALWYYLKTQDWLVIIILLTIIIQPSTKNNKIAIKK